MQIFKLSFVALFGVAATFAKAVPAAADSHPLVISHIVPVGEFNMTYWIDAPGGSATTSLDGRSVKARACSGTNIVQCTSGPKANSNECSQLIDSLNTNGAITALNGPRAICLGQDSGSECCVSWSDQAGNIPQGYLFNAAKKILQTCSGSTTSGVARNVDLGGACVTECLSGSPQGCSR